MISLLLTLNFTLIDSFMNANAQEARPGNGLMVRLRSFFILPQLGLLIATRCSFYLSRSPRLIPITDYTCL